MAAVLIELTALLENLPLTHLADWDYFLLVIRNRFKSVEFL
jgi:hypothetical protein